MSRFGCELSHEVAFVAARELAFGWLSEDNDLRFEVETVRGPSSPPSSPTM